MSSRPVHAPTLSAEDAAHDIRDGMTIAIMGSGGGLMEPDAILAAIEARFLKTGHPRDLTIVHAQGIGDRDRRGLNRLAHRGLVRRVIGGHWTWSPRMQALAVDNEIEAYALPGATISLLLRETGARRPGFFSQVGWGTFVDPRHGGGALNECARGKSLVDLIEIGGEEYLHYRPIPIDLAIVRGTLADQRGNITLDNDPADLDIHALALAARNSGGKIFVQCNTRSNDPVLPARRVRLPAHLVDAVILAPKAGQSHVHGYDPELSGQASVQFGPAETSPGTRPERSIIGRRAFRELAQGDVTCFGFGMADAVAEEISLQGQESAYHTIIDHGVVGGSLVSGDQFGLARGARAMLSSTDMGDFIHGGGVDVAFLGFGEIDANGNVNVSQLGGRSVGPGAFIDIAQFCRKLVLCGTFETGGLKCALDDGQLKILQPGNVCKFVNAVAQVTYSGAWNARAHQQVIVVTERAVFRIKGGRLVLQEIAAGVDLERDILSRMQFAPQISTDLQEMSR